MGGGSLRPLSEITKRPKLITQKNYEHTINHCWILIGGIIIWAGITGFSLKEINLGMFKLGKEDANSSVPQTKVEQTHYGSGDNVAGDKFVTENPANYKSLNDDSTQKLSNNLKSFKAENEEIKILLQFFTTDEGTKEFAYEFKKLMENA